MTAAQPLGNADEIQVGNAGGLSIREIIVNIMKKILDFMALIAVVTIVVAGIWLIVGLGEESAKERAKKIVLYTIVGLLLILLARAIVIFMVGLGS